MFFFCTQAGFDLEDLDEYDGNGPSTSTPVTRNISPRGSDFFERQLLTPISKNARTRPPAHNVSSGTPFSKS
jgi:hypothetical protein